jgi:hypothetical protein
MELNCMCTGCGDPAYGRSSLIITPIFFAGKTHIRAQRKRVHGQFPWRRASWVVHVLSFPSRRRRSSHRCPYACFIKVLCERPRHRLAAMTAMLQRFFRPCNKNFLYTCTQQQGDMQIHFDSARLCRSAVSTSHLWTSLRPLLSSSGGLPATWVMAASRSCSSKRRRASKSEGVN